jgi:DNA-binding FadR family transcriptional regulator
MANGEQSEFLSYLSKVHPASGEQLPSIQVMAKDLGISTGKLREQIELARQLGLIEVRPKTGIRTLQFSFSEAIRPGLRYALSVDDNVFLEFGVLRNHIEASFWKEAVQLLTREDKQQLCDLLDQAWEKLRGSPIQIPHSEHRDLHLTIYSRLVNPFVIGMLEAYWDLYEIEGLNVYSDYTYLESVWTYHNQMVQAIIDNDEEGGYQALIEHIGLLQNRAEIGRFQPKIRTSAGDGN